MSLEDIKHRVEDDAPVARGKVTSEGSTEEPLIAPAGPDKVLTPGNPEEEVTIKKSELANILDRLAILENSTSSNALSQAREKAAPKQLPSAFLKVFMKHIVIGWKSEQAELLSHPTNPNTTVGEILKSRYFFLDGGDSGIVDQIAFTKCNDRVMVRVLEDHGKSVKIKFETLITTDEDLQQSLKLPVDPIEIRKDYLNP